MTDAMLALLGLSANMFILTLLLYETRRANKKGFDELVTDALQYLK